MLCSVFLSPSSSAPCSSFGGSSQESRYIGNVTAPHLGTVVRDMPSTLYARAYSREITIVLLLEDSSDSSPENLPFWASVRRKLHKDGLPLPSWPEGASGDRPITLANCPGFTCGDFSPQDRRYSSPNVPVRWLKDVVDSHLRSSLSNEARVGTDKAPLKIVNVRMAWGRRNRRMIDHPSLAVSLNPNVFAKILKKSKFKLNFGSLTIPWA
ncbi:hypothetical protein B0H12DRAFT_1294858 [Mycena haematopus]|nr:hypothetical protein B0H12DRAFT_1294858 [Mycena haematopus]